MDWKVDRLHDRLRGPRASVKPPADYELSRIDAALDRLESGNFGYCETCGEAISVQRLDLDPTLSTCDVCAGD